MEKCKTSCRTKIMKRVQVKNRSKNPLEQVVSKPFSPGAKRGNVKKKTCGPTPQRSIDRGVGGCAIVDGEAGVEGGGTLDTPVLEFQAGLAVERSMLCRAPRRLGITYCCLN